jgi:hypothetical protein
MLHKEYPIINNTLDKKDERVIRKFFKDRVVGSIRVDETEIMNRLKETFPTLYADVIEESKKSHATEQLKNLWDKMKSEGNCSEYVAEMCKQLELLGTESNTLTKRMVHNEMTKVIEKINHSLL